MAKPGNHKKRNSETKSAQPIVDQKAVRKIMTRGQFLARRKFLTRAAVLGAGAGAIGLGGAGMLKSANALSATNTGYDWDMDSQGNFGLFDSEGIEILSFSDRGELVLFYPNTSTRQGSDLRVNFSNSLFGSGIPRIAFAMKWGSVLGSESVTVFSPPRWDVVYLMVGHLKITGFSGTNPVTFTVNYTDPPGANFTATLCSVLPTENLQNTDFSPVCEDIGQGTKITISVNLGEGDTVENMQGYLTFVEVDRRPGGSFNKSVPLGMDTGDANLQLNGFSIGAWDGQLR